MSSYTVTRLMIVLWCLQLPVVIFLPGYSNCWYFAVKNKLMYGGDIISIPSRFWAGNHFMWLDNNHKLWEYVYPKMPKNTPWYKLLIYKGKPRQIKASQG